MQTRRAPAHTEVTQPIQPQPAQQRTVAQAPLRPAVPTRQQQRAVPAPRLAPPPAYLPQRPPPRAAQRRNSRWHLWLLAGALAFGVMSCAAVSLMMGVIYTGGILPTVRAGGVNLGGMSVNEATGALQRDWQTITVRDGQRALQVSPADLGITLDANATAQEAYDYGRSDLSGALPGLLGHPEVAPVIRIDTGAAQVGLDNLATQIEQVPVNAGVAFVNGQVQATAPQAGRMLDTAATLANLQQNPGRVLADGMLELVMQSVQPAITDSTPMLEQARALLTRPLDIRVYDPITGDSVYWSAPPETWATWLTAQQDTNNPMGLSLTANGEAVAGYLDSQASGALDTSRYLKDDEAIASVQNAIANGGSEPIVRVYHHDGQHIVQSGETITSIAWDYGMPYLYIQEANGGLSSVSVGQSIMIPSPDVFLPFAVVPDKRIVVSISQQHAWVYENGALKWDWVASTGIPDSPTWPGIYQILSHEPNAYAGNWNLWMPNFMGVYKPIPGSDFTNGFHGFPTRGNSQLLWTNNLGTKVTYGCILLSNENAQLLYNWAEEGVVVEIQA